MICLIDCGSSYIAKLEKIFRELGYPSTVVALSEVVHTDFSSFSGVVISGSPVLITQVDTKRYVDQFVFLRDANVPILGICNGHQAIGLLYGAEISIGEGVKKLEQVTIVDEDTLFSGIENNSLFQEEHKESIMLPKNFRLLAKSASCGNEAMKHASKPIFGVQFHPEVSGGPGKRLIQNFLRQTKK